MKSDNATVFLTGVSSGIGQDAARLLVDAGYRVFGTVRNRSDAEPLTESLGDSFVPCIMDLTKPEEVAAAVEQLRAMIAEGDLLALVNNAGVGCLGSMVGLTEEELRRPFEVNVVGTFRVTQAFLPFLREAKEAGRKPRIVNVSSTSGRFVYPLAGAYGASKFGLEAMSDAYRRELSLLGIQVSVIQPWVTATPIWTKDVNVTESQGDEFQKALDRTRTAVQANATEGIPVREVSKVILDAVQADEPRHRYHMPGASRALRLRQLMMEWLPSRYVDRKVGLRPEG